MQNTKNTFQVAIHHNLDYGYIEYDLPSKTAKVVLHNPAKGEAVETFLKTKLRLQVPGKSVQNFVPRELCPLDTLEDLTLALTRLWEHTGVFVDWSRPLSYQMGQ
ncbi:hypothetical protein [Acetonema longum]|uniref:Uncharacterized protein n=1 Tax=Acetonema longum DSM 6540 TaxID=1009370 RepID=F7NIW5_9FIRM|nr:hypothetical protein [Acetonema longum]EGO63962.1 hypothetical protein ALO_10089 [Acetonema longum DSM 6540]